VTEAIQEKKICQQAMKACLEKMDATITACQEKIRAKNKTNMK
jgi:hypothetical protein